MHAFLAGSSQRGGHRLGIQAGPVQSIADGPHLLAGARGSRDSALHVFDLAERGKLAE